MMPSRIQRRRTKGWRMPEGAIYVGRGTRWGNDFRVGYQVQVTTFAGEVATAPLSAEMAVSCYADQMRTRLTPHEGDHPDDRAWVEEWQAALARLRGHDLACWCALDAPCHADLLLDLANPAPVL